MRTEVVLFEKENFVNLVAGIKFIPTFAVLTDDDCIRYAGQAVNLLNCLLGIFYAQNFAGDINVGSKIYIRYWRLPIRRFIFALLANTPSVSSVYGNRFFVANNMSLNANRYE